MKKIFFTLLTVLLATMAAQAATDYGFSVAGTTVTSDNCNNITNSYITRGTVYYTPSTNTLYMDNVLIAMTGDYNRVINNLECSGLKVVFSGTCTLYARDAAVVRIRKTTTLSAPSASTVVNIIGVNENGIWMATSNSFSLTIEGPGTFNISSTSNTAIEDENDGSGSQSDTWHEVYFDNVNAVLSSEGNSVVKRVNLRFRAGSSVRFKATNKSSYPVIDYCGWQVYGNERILEPYGGVYSNNTVCDSSGNSVYNQDVYVSDDYVLINNVNNFPDANFRNYLLGLYPKRYISHADINNCTTMDVSGKNIYDLQGIKYFTALKELRCYNNPIISLDVSGMTALTYLDCGYTSSYYNHDSEIKLISLNVSGCTNLETLSCCRTKISSLGVGGFSNLKNLNCSYNTSLTALSCYRDNLTSLNVTGCTALKELRCFENASLAYITGLNDCKAITYLDCEDCAIKGLDGVNNSTNITTLLARNNKLTTLEVTNKSQLTNLRVSGNTTLTTNLATITGLANCTAIIYLHCDYCSITSLPGVNNMTNITVLQARDNKLTTLEVTNKSQLRLLEVNGNTTLTTLNCFNNALTSLNVTNCSAMTLMSCYGNQLTSLSVQGCTALKTLYCYKNKISGTGMTTLVNSLPTRSALTEAQITTARNKYWLPKRWDGAVWVDLTASQRGDADGDGEVSISDVSKLTDYLLTGNASGVNLAGADADQDGEVAIADVSAIIDYLLSGTW